MKKIIILLSHPLSLSLFITVIMVMALFPTVPKYRLKIKEKSNQKPDITEYYDDLDGNGHSDWIKFTQYPDKTTAVTVLYGHSRGLREWRIRGSFVFTSNNNFFTGDYDKNGQKEIYVFTVVNDSLFLHYNNGLLDEKSVAFSRFISVVGIDGTDSKLYLNMVIGGLEDLNHDGSEEFVFGVNFGNPHFPRYVFSYDIKHDSLIHGPVNGYHLLNLNFTDIDIDGNKEIIVNGYASQNYHDTVAYPVHDLHCWLIVLNNQLRYLYPPRAFPLKGYSTLTTFAIAGNSEKNGFYSVYSPPLDSGRNAAIFHFSPQGQLINKHDIPEIPYSEFLNSFIFHDVTGIFLAIANINGEVYIFDTSLQFVKKVALKLWSVPLIKLDIDKDHEDEFLFLDCTGNRLSVFRQNLSNPAVTDISLDSYMRTNYSLKYEPGKPTLLVIDSGPNRYFLLYDHNPLYYTRWFLFAGFFASVFLLILLIARLQRLRIESRLKTEKKITELQLAIVRNQMDPHFTMNAINAVVDAINREEKEQARDNLLHFSKMYRSLVLSADKFKRPLRDEIEFTENYLALEQFRFRDRFRYSIDVHPEVDQNTEVPKMAIQSPVENAVKHGLSNKEGLGEVRINIRKEDKTLVIEVTDNGIGRQAAEKAEKCGTGKGMAMMEQFFELYQRITGVKVQSVVTDLVDETGRPGGMKVTIQIQLF